MHEIKLGEISVIWFGHASFMITDGEKKIYIDPYVLPSETAMADIVLITHEHFDHFDAGKIKKLSNDDTKIVGPHGVAGKLGFGIGTKADQQNAFDHVKIKSVEAYNVNKFHSPGNPFHPRGLGVGYVVEINNINIYHAGDTDNIKEMSSLENIDIALLPIGGTYTMTVSEAAEAATAFKPRFLIPMHYNSDKYGVTGINTNPTELARLLAGKGIVVNVLEPMV